MKTALFPFSTVQTTVPGAIPEELLIKPFVESLNRSGVDGTVVLAVMVVVVWFLRAVFGDSPAPHIWSPHIGAHG